MSEEDAGRDNDRRLQERLAQLEELLRMQTVRLHAIEQRLGLDYRPPDPDTHARPHTDDLSPALPNLETPEQHPSQETPNTGAQPTQTPQAPGSTSISPDQADTHAAPRQRQPSYRSAPFEEEPAHEPRRADTSGARGDGADASAPRAPRPSPQSESGAGFSASRRLDLETRIGGSWFSWAGIIATVFGVSFFLKLAFENQWIGATARVLLGASAGLALLVAGDRLRVRGLRQYAYVLSGGGVLILYLSAYAAFAFYNLIGQIPAFVLMTGVTALAVLLSVRYDALAIAVLGLVGGFLTPPMLSTGEDREAVLFSYVALLDAGVLALAYFKQWRSLNHLAFIATCLTALGWTMLHYTKEKLFLTLFFLTLFFVLFSMLAVVHNVLRERPARWPDISLIIANATFYFAMSYWMLDEAGYAPLLGSFALLVSAFYLLLYYFAYTRRRSDRLLVYSLLGAAITFFTSAVSIQLDLHWVTIVWATESVVLTWVGLRSETSAPRHAALFVFVVAVLHWLTNDLFNFAYRPGASFTPLLNARAASCAALVAACALIGRLYRQTGAQKISEEERTLLLTIFVLAANVLALTLLTFDVNDYFALRRAALGEQARFGAEGMRLDNTRHFVLTATWTLYATVAIIVGILRRIRALRALSLLLLSAAVCKLLLIDLSFYAESWHTPFFNQTFFAFALVVAALAVLLRAYARSGDSIDKRESAFIRPALVVVANLLAVVVLSAEASGYFEARIRARRPESGELGDLRLAQQLALSVIWTIYGGAMLAYGHLRGNRMLRLMALFLLGATILKVFFFDLVSLDRVYRIVSFIVLGLILLAVSYLYQKRRQAEAEA
ncbi:MAG TPA: DUF2339 domain-containing protein [Pyrinomonadaceae bacterium]|jgi:uncharacterized membrane protein